MYCSICLTESIKDPSADSDSIVLFNEKYAYNLINQCEYSDNTMSNLKRRFIVLKCKHVFHIQCILDYISYNTCYCIQCPMCRCHMSMNFTLNIREKYYEILQGRYHVIKQQLIRCKFRKVVYKILMKTRLKYSNMYNQVSNLEDIYLVQLQKNKEFRLNLTTVKHTPCKLSMNFYK